MKLIVQIAAALMLAATPALAGGEVASGAELSAAVSGKTIQGSMKTSGNYTEYYAPDGTLKGKGYTGTWRVDDQNRLCVKYDTEMSESCWHGRVESNNVTWVRDGREDGGGAISDGDAGGFRDNDGGRR
jgi:hypothetical protein